jgi:putative hydrolase of the HAD superfamily
MTKSVNLLEDDSDPINAARPSVLLFDLGGVLIANPGFAKFNRLLLRQLELQELKSGWLMSPAVRRFESGQSDAIEFALGVLAEWQIEMDPAAFVEEFRGWPSDATVEAIELVRELKEEYTVACLSNSNAIHWERFTSLLGEFDIAISSHLTGRLKPDQDAFLEAARLCSAAPREICFFDDSILNVEAAASVGFHAFLVDGFSEIKDLLSSRGW